MILDHVDILERALIAKGWPAMSPWWREQIERFYRSGRRQFVLRVGRRGGKSSTLCRVAVLEALYGDHKIQPGDVGIVGIVSVSRDEASQRLRTIKSLLDALGVKYSEKTDSLTLESRPIVFKVFTGSVAGVVGGTWICGFIDEVARLRDSDTGANPAKEVLASLRPTLATMPNAKLFLSSSPLGAEDAHAVAFDLGETEFQCVAHAESWVANESITEAETRALEPDPRIWSREFAAIPSTAVNGAFDPEHVDRGFAATLPTKNVGYGAPIIVCDPSSAKHDEFVWSVVRWILPASLTHRVERKYVGAGLGWIWEYSLDANGHRIELEQDEFFRARLHIGEIHGIRGNFANSISADAIVTRIANDARAAGASLVASDQRESYSLQSLFSQRGLQFVPIVWSAPSKAKFVEHARMLMREKKISFAADPILRKQLCEYEERITASGTFIYSGRGNRSDDRAALVLTACGASLSGLIPSDPHAKRVHRNLTYLPQY
jgi:hypothetical protein